LTHPDGQTLRLAVVCSHPAFVGKIVWSSVRPLSALVWNSICAQTLAKPVEGPAPSATPERGKKSWWKFGRD
jgi:hypothetical protein